MDFVETQSEPFLYLPFLNNTIPDNRRNLFEGSWVPTLGFVEESLQGFWWQPSKVSGEIRLKLLDRSLLEYWSNPSRVSGRIHLAFLKQTI